VTALANQTLAQSSNAAGFKQAFTGRIHALAKTHNLISRKQWTNITMEQLLRDGLALHAQESSRVMTSGPQILLRPQIGTRAYSPPMPSNTVLYRMQVGTFLSNGRLKPNLKPGAVVIEWVERGGLKNQQGQAQGIRDRAH
jgi:hypothetical protein